MNHTEHQHRWDVILAFALVYVFWGSTYLGIRIAVEHVPPVLMAGIRFFIAGSLMLVWCKLTGKGIRLGKTDAWRLLVTGILLLSVANAVLAWAEKSVPTGLAALIVSVTPMWFLILETWVLPSEHRASPRALMGLGLGAIGIVILVWPQVRNVSSIGYRELIGSLSLLGSSLSWAIGSVLSKQWKMKVHVFTASGYQMMFAGMTSILLGTLIGDWSRASWSPRGIGAILYLVVFGSWVGFSAYVWLLKHVPMTKVATYAYVNPVVAVFLGWFVLDEKITGFILAGSVVVVSAVALVSGAKLITRNRVEEPELPMVEASAD